MAFQNAAVQLRSVADALRGHLVRLGLNWSGQSAGRFLEEFGRFPYRLDALAEGLDVQAAKIEHKTVTMIETVMLPPPGAEPD